MPYVSLRGGPEYEYYFVGFIMHGDTALTRTPNGASSNAFAFVSESMPALVML